MRKISMVAILSIITITQVAATEYTAKIKDGELTSIARTEETGEITFEIGSGFPVSADLLAVVKKLIIDKEEEYIFQKKSVIEDVFPWKFKEGEKFRFTRDDTGTIQSYQIKTDSGLSDKIKKYFYGYLGLMMIIFVLVAWGIVLTEHEVNFMCVLFLVAAAIAIVVVAAGVAVVVAAGAVAIATPALLKIVGLFVVISIITTAVNYLLIKKR